MITSQPQATLRRKLLAAARVAAPVHSRSGRVLPRVFFLTDPERTPHPERIAARLPKGFGIIFRHYGSDDREVVGARLAQVCRRRGIALLVAADPALALRLRADGVHWPESRLRGVRHRKPRWIETASAHGRMSLARAARLDIDAAILSPVFPSASPSAATPMGGLRFRIMSMRSPLPVYALGGVTGRNAQQALSGASKSKAGWAAIEAVMSGWGS